MAKAAYVPLGMDDDEGRRTVSTPWLRQESRDDDAKTDAAARCCASADMPLGMDDDAGVDDATRPDDYVKGSGDDTKR